MVSFGVLWGMRVIGTWVCHVHGEIWVGWWTPGFPTSLDGEEPWGFGQSVRASPAHGAIFICQMCFYALVVLLQK